MNMFLIALMQRVAVPWKMGKRVVTIGPEERICIDFADELRFKTLQGDFRAVWLHIPNEAKRHPITALILKAMGIMTGAPDYVFCWKGGCGFIEFKSGKGKQTEWQKYFQSWCEYAGIPYVVCRSVADGTATLREWGVM